MSFFSLVRNSSYICVSKYFIRDDLVVSGDIIPETFLSRDIVTISSVPPRGQITEDLNKIKFLHLVFN